MLTSELLKTLYCTTKKEGGQVEFLLNVFCDYYKSEVSIKSKKGETFKQAVKPIEEANACTVFNGLRLLPQNLVQYYLEGKGSLRASVQEYLVSQYEERNQTESVAIEICRWIAESDMHDLDKSLLLKNYVEGKRSAEDLSNLITEAVWFSIQFDTANKRR